MFKLFNIFTLKHILGLSNKRAEVRVILQSKNLVQISGMPCDIDFFPLDSIIKNLYLTINVKKWTENSLFHVLYLVRAGVLQN